MRIFGDFFLPQNEQRGYEEQHLFHEFLKFIIEIFHFIIALAQKYQFFAKVPLGLRLWILWTLFSLST